MRQTPEVTTFLENIERSVKDGKEITKFVKEDVNLFQIQVRDFILRNRIHFDESWTMYQFSDVDIYYDADVLKTLDRLDLYGILDYAPPLRGNDTAATLMYRFTALNKFGNELDMATGYHVIVRRPNGIIDNRRIFVYG